MNFTSLLLRRALGTVAVAALTVGTAACGDEETGEPTQPGPTDPPGSQIDHPTDPDEAILVFTRSSPWKDGGVPGVVIGGDGKVYLPGEPGGGAAPQAVAPPPAGPSPVMVGQLSEEGVQRVLALAAELDLLDHAPEYADVSVTDSGSTSLTITTSAGTVEHVAYALGVMDEEADDDRRRFEEFASQLDEFQAFTDDDPRDLRRYVPETWNIATWGSYAYFDDEVPMLWPDGIDVEEGCVALDIAEFPTGVGGRYVIDNGTADEDDDELYAVAPDLPGDRC